jgi:hypothetical protein
MQNRKCFIIDETAWSVNLGGVETPGPTYLQFVFTDSTLEHNHWAWLFDTPVGVQYNAG